jgi:hypothetical protein
MLPLDKSLGGKLMVGLNKGYFGGYGGSAATNMKS